MSEPAKSPWKLPTSQMFKIMEESVGYGRTGLVQLLPGGKAVRKSIVPWVDDRDQPKQLRHEISVYRHLPNNHRRIVRMLACEGDHGETAVERTRGTETISEPPPTVSITLEYMPNGPLSQYLAGGSSAMNPSAECMARGRAIPRRQRASWALEATDSIAFLHAHGVIHADIKPENMVLDNQLRLRIIDFSGSSLLGSDPYTLESTPFFLPRNWGDDAPPGEVCNVTTDLFALGSSLYQIATCRVPWHELWAATKLEEIEARFRRGEFPDLSEPGPSGQDQVPVQFSSVIDGCWHARITSATDVLAVLRVEVLAEFGPEDQAWIEQQSGLSLDAKETELDSKDENSVLSS